MHTNTYTVQTNIGFSVKVSDKSNDICILKIETTKQRNNVFLFENGASRIH